MRRPFILALVSSASLGLLTAAGCSSTDDPPGGSPNPDSGSPDSAKPVDDASTPDADASPPDSGPHAPGWDPDFSLPGVAGRVAPSVWAMARVAARQIAVAGNFEQAGSIPTKFVALWNGDKWLSIGAGLSTDIEQMVATPTGELYGATSDKGNWKIVKWNKTIWSEVASFDGVIESIEMGPGGKLYVGGSFTTIGALPIANAASFDGTTWTAVSNAPEGIQTIRSLGDKICVGVRAATSRVSCLEGGTWTDMPFGPQANINSLSDIAEQNGELVLAGQFSLDWSSSGGSLARWNGTRWELIGGGLEGVGSGEVRDIQVDGSKIYVTGRLSYAGGQMVSHVAMFDTAQSRWFTLNDGIFGVSGGWGAPPPGRSLVIDQGGEIYVGGSFSMIGGRNALGIARWDGNQWNPVDDPTAKRLGVNGGVSAIAEGPNGSVYVGGEFPLTGGDVAATNIGRLENGAWSPLGPGLDGFVAALAVNGTTVYAGGSFLRSGAAVTQNVARWNGAAWSGLGSGLDGRVTALTIGPDGNVYAGGEFTHSGTAEIPHVAKWDGTSWKSLGDGFDDAVDALMFDSSGKLHAGGRFTHSGKTEMKRIAVWNGTQWAAMGAGVEAEYTASVSAIVTYQGKITIGGSFTKSGAAKVEGIAAWDGSAWTAVGGGVRKDLGSPGVESLTVRGNELYVAGLVPFVGAATDAGPGMPVRHIAVWNGTTWSGLGTAGLSDLSRIAVATSDSLWIGGGFTFAGDQGSYNLARFWFDH